KYGAVTIQGTATTPATVRDNTYDELIEAEKIHEGCVMKQSEKLIGVTPKNKNKKVRFTYSSSSSRTTPKQTDSNEVKEDNKLVLPSTRISTYTEARRSKTKSQTKINMISRNFDLLALLKLITLVEGDIGRV
nr:hypothetical protein [Tanacetum cinerariifolium]